MKNDYRVVVLPSFYPMEFNYTRGGFFEEQSRLIKAQQVDVSVIFNEDRSLQSFSFQKFKKIHFQKQFSIEEGLPVLRKLSWNLIPTKFELGRKLWAYNAIKLVEFFIHNYFKPDLIHVHCAFSAGFVAQYIKRKYHIPYIITEHSTFFSVTHLSEKQKRAVLDIYGDAEQVVVVSHPFKAYLSATIGLPMNRMIVLPNFIDVDYFKAFSPVPSRDGNKTIFTVCHHVQKKRLDRLIDAFKLVLAVYPDWKLLIGGAGALTDALKLKVRQLGLMENISFCGFLSKAEVREKMNQSQIFALSSDVETFGVVLIEAMAMGLPVVATKSGGPEDIVTENTGVLVDKTVESLARGMCEVIEKLSTYDPQLIRQHVLDHFSGAVVSAQYIRLYQDSIRNFPSYFFH